MRILIFATNYLPSIGGAELALREITDRLGNDFSFDLVTAKHSFKLAPEEQIGAIRVYRVGWGISWLDKLFLALWGHRKAADIYKNQKYDAILSLQASYGGIAAYFFKKRFPLIPFVLNLQEGKELNKQVSYIRFWRKKIIESADHIVAISKYLRDYAKGLGFDPERISIIPNGVDYERYSREFSYGELEEIKDRLGLRPYGKTIITVSRLEKKNNIEGIIDAVNEMGDEDVKLVIVGEGSLGNYLQTKVKNLNLEDRVRFVGSIDNNELPKYLSVSNIFVRPSLSEGLGTAFLEAMAVGLPIVGTKTGGIPDFLKDFRTGLFCTENPRSIAEKISLLLNNVELRKALSRNASKLISEKYRWDIVADQYGELFRGL
jgi:glycosyltransferase involved in cell wall biosynthesis